MILNMIMYAVCLIVRMSQSEMVESKTKTLIMNFRIYVYIKSEIMRK